MTSSDRPATSFREILESFYDAEQRYVAGGGAKAGADFSEMASHLHPHVVGHQGPTVPFSGDWFGIDGFKRFFAVFSSTWSHLELSDLQYFEGENGLAIQMRMRATSVSTGTSLDTRVGHFIEFEGGLIRKITVYYHDPVQVLRSTQA